jgi:hypothetical protein
VKTFLKVIGVLVLLVVVAIGAIFYFTSGMVTAVDEFFATVAAQDMTNAHKYLAQEFRAWKLIGIKLQAVSNETHI